MKHRFLLLSLCVFALALACDSASPVAPSGTVLSINANPTKISLSGDPSTITVTGFKPDGNPLNPGTQLLVSTDIGDLYDAATGGNLVSTLEIGGNGRALAYLIGDGRGGTATVTATLTTGGEATATATIQVGETAESKPTLIMSANPQTVDIGEESTITVIARAADGTSLGAGQRVRFTTTLGVLDPSAKDTDANGEVEVLLKAESESGDAVVEALLGTSDPVSTTITIRDAAETITVEANPASIPSDGNSDAGDTPTTLTALIRNAQGEPFGGAAVNFSARIFGTESGIGSLSSGGGSVLTNSQGESTDTFRVRGDEITDANGVIQVNCIEVRAQVAAAGGALKTATDRIPIDGGTGCP